jgi:thymidylate kinase
MPMGLFKPMKGKLISFIGMDGAGKTTLVKALAEHLNKQGKKAVMVYGGRGRGNVLPIQFLGKAYRKAGGSPSNVPQKGESFEKISLIHTLAAPLFALDMLARYFLILWPLTKKNDFVLTDRYATDILLMNKVPWDFKRFLFSLLPKPNKIVYIYNTVAVLHKRKPEHSVVDLRRQEKLFERVVPLAHATKIKNEIIGKSLKNILEVI